MGQNLDLTFFYAHLFPSNPKNMSDEYINQRSYMTKKFTCKHVEFLSLINFHT